MNKNEKTCYLGAFIKKLYIFPSLLIACFVCVVLYFGNSMNALEQIKMIGNGSHFIFTLIAFGLFFVLNFIYMLLSSKKKEIKLVDALSFAFILIGLFYIVLLTVINNDFNIVKLVVAGLTFVVGLVFTIIFSVNFNKTNVNLDAYPLQNNFKGYLSNIFNNYFFFILLFAFAFLSFNSLFNSVYYIISLIASPQLLAVTILLVLPIMLYFTTSISSKHIGLIDPLLIAMLISLSLSITQSAFFIQDQTLKFLLSSGGLIVVLLAIILRNKFIDLSLAKKEYLSPKERGKVSNYFAKLFAKFNPLEMLAISSVLTIVLLLTMFRFNNLFHFIKVADKKLAIALDCLPYLVVNLVGYGSLIFSAVISLVNINSSKITIGDYMLFYCLAFVVFASITLFIKVSLFVGCGLLLAGVLLTFILGARIRKID